MRRTALALCLATLGMGYALAADPQKIDWSKIKPVEIPLFYPGQSSYQWLRSEAHRSAWEETRRGDACTTCHDPGDERDDGDKIVKGNRLEPTPIKGKNGFVDLKVQAAYDQSNAYLRFQWKTQSPHPGGEYPYQRFDGKEWKPYGFPKLNQSVRDGKQPGIYEDRMSVMIDDGKVPGFAAQGCWLTCHDGERDMPKQATRDEVLANALMKAIKRNDVRKYLPSTRTDPMDWRTGKPIEEIAKIKAEGGFLDLIQWRAHRSNPVGMADDGYVLEWRNFDAGSNMFGSNADAKTKQPRFMWDEKKAGFKATTAAQLRKRNHFLIREENAVPFDPSAGWKEGDMLPSYFLTREGAKGSAADNKAIASWKDGVWTVVMIRPLGLTNADDKALKDGAVYNVGFAVHDDNVTSRAHYVSFVRTLGFGVKADIQAVKLP
ncbi:MAG: hypothetical protein EHM59_14035 [Betaproteobacteria bacterium]|nr:MAG: hypothetical protein EHM59_14035 [Betaproteobacteria bacterium]